MKLKTYQAPTIPQAMAQVRLELGGDAIIISSQETYAGAVVVAAQDDDAPLPQPQAPHAIEQVIACLESHKIRPDFMQRLVSYAAYATAHTKTDLLTQILLPSFNFAPLAYPRAGAHWALMGPPGVGKTATIAKLAAYCMINDLPVVIVTLDKDKAGAVEQIRTLGHSLSANVIATTDRDMLHRVLAQCPSQYVALVDTPGINPHNGDDLQRVQHYLDGTQLCSTVILNGIGNEEDLLDQSRAFATLHAQRLVLTQMDLVRRLGAFFTLLDAGPLPLCAYSEGPLIADLLTPVTAYQLADFLVRKEEGLAGCASSTNQRFAVCL